MNKAELIQHIAAKTGQKVKTVEALLNAFAESVEEALLRGEKATISGFGAFSILERKARKGRNPRTGEEIHVPASSSPKFTAGKKLKEAVG